MISVSPINIYWRDVRCPLVIDWHPGWAQAQRSQRESGAGTQAFRVALRQLSNQIKSPAIGVQSADERFLFLFFSALAQIPPSHGSFNHPTRPWVQPSLTHMFGIASKDCTVCGIKTDSNAAVERVRRSQNNVILFCWFSKWTFKWSWDVPEHVNVFVYEMLYAFPPTLC